MSSPVVTIQIGGAAAPPIFCFPGAGASVTSFWPLAQALGPDATIYGLEPRGLDGQAEPHATVAAAATDGIEALRRKRRRGPYRFIGHSFGGWIAFEMARQLAARGEIVQPLVLLDSEPPSGDSPAKLGRIETLLLLIRFLEQGSGSTLDLPAAELEALDEEAQLARLLQRMIAKGVLPPGTALQVVRGMVRVFTTNLETPYAPPSPLFSTVLLIRPEDHEQTPEQQENDLAIWRCHAPHVRALTVPGNHITMLKRPNVDRVVERVVEVWR